MSALVIERLEEKSQEFFRVLLMATLNQGSVNVSSLPQLLLVARTLMLANRASCLIAS